MELESKPKKIERTVLDSESIVTIKKMLDQADSELGDMVHITQKVMANFIIKNRIPTLTRQELEQLKTENYDLIKALKHATDKAITARQNGDSIEISDVLKLIQTSGVKLERPPQARRGRKKKNQDSIVMNQADIEPVKAKQEG